MIDSPRLHASRPDDGETLPGAIKRVARSARWQILAACVLFGSASAIAASVFVRHRVLPVSAALTLAAFGAGGLADRGIIDQLAAGDRDRVLLVGFSAIRWLSVAVGTGAAITFLMWILFAAMGGSRGVY